MTDDRLAHIASAARLARPAIEASPDLCNNSDCTDADCHALRLLLRLCGDEPAGDMDPVRLTVERDVALAQAAQHRREFSAAEARASRMEQEAGRLAHQHNQPAETLRHVTVIVSAAVALLPGCEREGCGDKATRIHEGQVFCATHAPPGALRIVGADQILLLADIIRQNA